MDRASGLAGCTVVSKNHLAYARVVCESFRRHHPSAPFFVLLADGNKGQFCARHEPFELIELDDLRIPDLPRLCFQYDILELNCAAKPYLLQYVLQRPGNSKLVYLDADTFVFRQLTEAWELLDRHSIVLTPHLISEAEEDGRKPGERHIMESGVYNAGFLGVRKDATTERFMNWWSRRVYDKCIADPRLGLFVDQRWLDLVPGLFDGVCILRHAGYNFGHWGLTHRDLEIQNDGQMRVNDAPLALFHFSGVDVERPEFISKYQDRFSFDDKPALKPLFEDYAARVRAAGYAECQKYAYAYASFDNGVPIPRDVRRFYWSLGDGVRRFGNPFATAGAASFWKWLRAEAHVGSGVSRLWYHVHATRPDLRQAFPDIFGKDRLAFLSWATTRGCAEHGIPRVFEPAGPPAVCEPGFGRPRSPTAAEPPGVNVAGNGMSEKGVGEAVRAMVRSLTAARIPYCVIDQPDSGSANRDRTLVDVLQENPYPVNLIHFNAVALPWFVHVRGPKFFRGKYNIGYWLWELPELPEAFHGSFAYLDEVWVSSNYCLESVSRVSPVPVVKMPLALPVESMRTKGVGRDYFGLQERDCVFLFMFDAHSVVERKNPSGVIQAFKRAFPTDPDVRLVLKLAHGTRRIQQALQDEAGDSRIVVIDRVFDREEINSLIEVSDCYVSLHRSEGFGLTLAEAMALGKPVIATGYSANLDFMNASNSLLVQYEMVRLARDFPPYPRGSPWADPDIDHAAELMQAVYENPHRARQIGQRARRDIWAYLSPDVVGARIRERLAMIGRDLEAPGSIFRD